MFVPLWLDRLPNSPGFVQAFHSLGKRRSIRVRRHPPCESIALLAAHGIGRVGVPQRFVENVVVGHMAYTTAMGPSDYRDFFGDLFGIVRHERYGQHAERGAQLHVHRARGDPEQR